LIGCISTVNEFKEDLSPASYPRLLNVTGTVFGASVSSSNKFVVKHVVMISVNKIVLFQNKKINQIMCTKNSNNVATDGTASCSNWHNSILDRIN
jgi:hypothetical protein